MSEQTEKYAIENSLQLFGSEEEIVDVSGILLWLEENVYSLLQNDFNRLINILYRIDVYESKAKECFGKQNREIAKCLAQLIWERQLQKAKTR